MKPRGAPVWSKRVIEPLGVVLVLVICVVVVVVVVRVLADEGAGVPEVVVREELEEMDEMDVSSLLCAAPLKPDSVVAVDGGLELVEGTARVTTLMPMPSLLLAGMTSVVCPSLRLRDVRSGW
jgi:hypothetical protein